MVTKEIKKAIDEVLAARIDKSNYGMFSTKRVSFSAHNMLAKNCIKITSELCTTDKVLQGENVIANITYRYAAHKRNGMYKMLKPQVVYL